jgi:hypothetical protein
LLHATAAIDSGEIVNPDGIRNQTEGGILQSMSWTLFEAVQFNQTRVTSAATECWYTITDSFDTDFGVAEWHGHNGGQRPVRHVLRKFSLLASRLQRFPAHDSLEMANLLCKRARKLHH